MRTALLLAFTAVVGAGDSPSDLPNLVFDPQSYSVTKNVHYGESGTTTSQLSSLLDIAVFPDRTLFATNQSGPFEKGDVVLLDEVITDTGESLLGTGTSGHLRDHVFAPTQPGWLLTLVLKVPTKPCRTITKVSGSILVQVAVGEPRKVIYRPLSDFTGRPLAITDLPGVEVTIEREPTMITVTGPNAVFEAEITFTDGNGKGLPQLGGTPRKKSDSKSSARYPISVPSDGAIVFTFKPEVRTVRVPISLTDLPVTGPEGPVTPKAPKIRWVPLKGFEPPTADPPTRLPRDTAVDPPVTTPDKPTDF